MTFNDEEFEALAPYEKYFLTVTRSNYATYPGDAALTLIHETFTGATRDRRLLNKSCGDCVLNLLRDCGRIWLRDRDERLAAELAEKEAELKAAADELAQQTDRAVEAIDTLAETVKAVEVKTTKPAKKGQIRVIKPKAEKTPAKSAKGAQRKSK